MNEVLQAVLDYVQTPQTDYALLITGPWGCGKTYFWKNVAAPQLMQLPQPHRPRRVLYVSLYGVSDVKDIDRSLFAQSYPGINRKSVGRISRLAAGVFEALGYVDLAKIDLRSLIQPKGAVICFDDLERAKVPMKEALGYINSFVEHEGAKAIILCNEDMVGKDDRTDYEKLKEKVVGASLTFQPDLDAVFRTLIGEHKSRVAFHSFISQNAALLRHLFDRSETHNIRSLRRAIAALAVIIDALHAAKVDPSAVAKQLVYAVAPAAFELHGRAANPAGLRKILGMELMVVAVMHLSDRGSEKTDEEKYEGEFAERYLRDLGLSEWRDAVGCPPICEFLLTGVLDRPALVSWAERLTKPPDEREERIKRLSSGAREMEDEEFARTAAQVLAEVEAGEVAAVGTYMTLYYIFEWFATMGLIAMTRQEVLGKFASGLRKAQEAGRLEPNAFLDHEIDHPVFAPKTDEGRSLRRHVLEANEKALGRGARERIQALVSRRKEDAQGFIDALAGEGESGLLFTPVFQELVADDTAAWLLALPNGLKVHFAVAVRARYGKHTPPAEFLVELPVLTRIRDVLKAHCGASPRSSKPMPMSLFAVRGIVEVLDSAINDLSQLERPRGAPAPAPGGAQPRKEVGGNGGPAPAAGA